MRLFLLGVAQSLVLFASAQKKSPYADGLYAEVTTTKGLIVLQLEFEKTPMTVANFVGLSEGTIANTALPPGKHYYDGTKWHRVVPNHVIQCGAPAGTDKEGPGYTIPNEIAFPDLNHSRAGMVGMANGGPHTNGSQWYITLGDRSYLDPDYPVFGHVIKGLEVTAAITQDDVIKTIKIFRVGKKAELFRPVTDSFLSMVEETKIRVKEKEEQAKVNEEAFIRQQWPDAQSFMRYSVLQQGEGQAAKPGSTMTLRYTAQFPGGGVFISTSDGGKPWFGSAPENFSYTVGSAGINPGFNAGVSQMRKGEKRVLIVPSAQAYGVQGYYPPERKGEKRFHVSPNQTIVYEVECIDLK